MRKGCLVGCGFTLLVIISSFIFIGVQILIKETKDKEPSVEEQVVEEPVEEPTMEEQKEYYLNTIRPEIDKFKEKYEEMQEEDWQPTIEDIYKSNVDFYAVYNNLKVRQKTYSTMDDNLPLQDEIVKNISRENRGDLLVGIRSLQHAAANQIRAAGIAMEMLGKEDLSLYELDIIQSRIQIEISFSEENYNEALSHIAAFELIMGITKSEENEEEKK